MDDTTGQPICKFDLVMFPKTGGAHHDRGVVMKTPLPGTKLSVLLVDGTVVAKDARDLTVVDRSSLYPGMPVVSASHRGGQAGIVTGVTLALDLAQLGGAVVATGVSPAEVRPVKEVNVGDYVVSGPWLGRVVEVSVDVDVLFDDDHHRSVCRVTGAGKKLHVVREGAYRPKNAFFPGEAVTADASVFKASRWLKGYWKPTRGEGTVAKVEIGGVLVYWVASRHLGTETHVVQESAPPAYQQSSSRDLTFFCPGDGVQWWCWGVSERCFLRSRPTPKKKKKKQHQHRMRKRTWRVADPGLAEFERPLAVAHTYTTADVLWQDGTRQRGVPSASLLRIQVRNQQDFFPGQRVMGKKMSPVGADDIAAGRVGVVKSLSYQDQTVCVSWITAPPGESSCEVDTVMSTYDLYRSSPDQNFFYGDIVVRLRPIGSAKEEMVPVQRSNKATSDLSWVGHIVGLCDAPYLEVRWGDGNTSKVLLHEIAFVKPRHVEDILKEMGDWVYDDEDDALGKAQEGMPHQAPSSTDNNGDGGEGGDNSDSMAITSKVGNIIQAVIRTAGRMLTQGRRYQLVRGSEAPAKRKEHATTESVQPCSSPMSGGNGDCHAKEAAAAGPTDGDVLFQFQHFDVVPSPHDHHYLGSNEQGNGGGTKWHKRVQKEWKILDSSLPDTIYVRAFEDRMDLLRTAMVGASGTPYHDGLFFFDLQLPTSYPAAPPQVKYHSFGLRVNPNLYPSGTVCLSLLNTFGGEGPELWSPETSSILQVVVSIQGLVLTPRPYYNEAGYAAQVGTPEGHRNELPYCENTYLANLHTMLHLIRRPLSGFEAFVTDHFQQRGRHILRACETYLKEGCPVGMLDVEAHHMEVSKERSCSMGFRLALANTVPLLVEAFAMIGAEGCDEFDHLRV